LPISRTINSAQRVKSAASIALATPCRCFARVLASSAFQSLCAFAAAVNAASISTSVTAAIAPAISSVAGSITGRGCPLIGR
jgi:hypothetical protein